ncbi:MAG: hypothetical protein CR997_00760 [Acidobacteria bacterium]|nr:MAG: hypothetical protein CR997_00760 [Acidobacteriota bacterium]
MPGMSHSEFICKNANYQVDAQTTQMTWETGKKMFINCLYGKKNRSVCRKETLKGKNRLKRR